MLSAGGRHFRDTWRKITTGPMVSHAELANSSRGAPLVSSRSGRSRHRYVHHGSTAALIKDEFPSFARTGDVEILVHCEGQEKRYLLHRLMLAQFSGFFGASMSDERPRAHAQRELHRQQEQESQQALSVVAESASSNLSIPLLAPEQASATSPSRKRWHYELNWDAITDEEEPILVQKPPPGHIFTPTRTDTLPQEAQPPPTSSNRFFRSMANLAVRPALHGYSQSAANLTVPPDTALLSPLLRDYDNLFRICYNYAPLLNNVNIASAYSECKSLLGLADIYDALLVVGPRIEHHLLAFSSRLFKQIAKYPPSYLKLGYLARSKVIFSEALTHVVGQWPQAYPYLKPSHHFTGYEVPAHVLDLIEDKVDDLEELKTKVEAKLFRLTLTTSRGERVNPSNDYLGWLAMSLFRQWLAENTTPEVRGILKSTPALDSRPSTGSRSTSNLPAQEVPLSAPTQVPAPSPASSGRVFRLIASTNPELYLGHDELKRFLKVQPGSNAATALYSKDNLRRLERRMDQIKNIARDMVKPLTRNCLELDLRLLDNGQGGGLGYMTCTKVEEEDFPW